MRNPSGYSVITEPGQRAVEHDTISCAHCGFINFTVGGFGRPLQVAVIKGDGTTEMRDAAKCFTCDEYICPRAGCRECVPKLKRIEREEAAARKLILP